MLRRQRAVLSLIAAEGVLPATRLQKYIFLLRQETFLRADLTFYEFLPYKFGPYSFAAHRETEALRTYGYIERNALRITRLGTAEAERTDPSTAGAVSSLASEYRKRPLRRVLQEIYARYPWYASNTELRYLLPAARPKPRIARPAVYTIGYQTRSIDGFLDSLLRAGIRRIMDVRANPVSRKYGFARSTLASLAGKLGLAYNHLPGLGISSALRRDVHGPSGFRELFDYYERHILVNQADAAGRAADMMVAGPSALLCMEKDPLACHRSRLASRLARATRLEIVHL